MGMSLKEFLEKTAGTRFCCACECCGQGNMPPEADDGIGFDRLLAVRLIIASLLFAAALVIGDIPEPWPLVMLIVSAVIAGYDMIAAAVLAAMNRHYMDKCILILAAAVLTIALGRSAEGAALVLLFQLGGALTGYAFARTRQSVLSAVSCDAENAHLLKDGTEELVPAGRPVPGDRIVIYPGERVPCDGIILEGSGSLDVSPIGGGEDPQLAAEGDEILAGSISLDGKLRCEVTAAQADSTAAALQKAVRTAFDTGSPVPRGMRRFLDLYTPVMLILTVLAAGILPLIYKIGISYAIHRALVFLVLANPCALVVSLPLIRFCGIGRSAGGGVLFQACRYGKGVAYRFRYF
jgi:Cd2+/Zn2+-exporting ATPase